MILALFSLLPLILQSVKGSIEQPGSCRTIQPNVLVLTQAKNSSVVQVPLQCGNSYEARKIVWRNKGREVAQGNRITVIVEEMLGGNYTCYDHSGSYLNHTLVLVQAIEKRILEKSDNTDYIQCVSQNYSGVFQCFWRWNHPRKGDVLLVAAARSSVKISCSLDTSGQSVTCRDHTHCPYGEEKERVTLTMYVKHDYRVEKYTRNFYITEIVKPDRIKITKVDQNTFEWGYPETWSIPASYFPLTFQVKVIPLKQNCDCEHRGRKHRKIELHTTHSRRWSIKKGFLFCVRAQDALCNSTWSDWSQDNETYSRPFNTSRSGTSVSKYRNHQKKDKRRRRYRGEKKQSRKNKPVVD